MSYKANISINNNLFRKVFAFLGPSRIKKTCTQLSISAGKPIYTVAYFQINDN